MSDATSEKVQPFTDYWDATDGEARVFKIDDGEVHWYVAKDYVAALEEHYDIYTGCWDDALDVESITLSVIAPDKRLTRNEINYNEDEVFPPTFERNQNPGGDPTVTATAADWAAYYLKSAPVQLMSSVY